MSTTLVVSALCLLLLGTVVGVKAVGATRARHWLGGTIQGLGDDSPGSLRPRPGR